MSLVITKETGNFFSLVLDGGEPIISEQNRLTTFGNLCNFKTANGANLILKQNILVTEITVVASGTFTFTDVNDLWNKLIEINFFDGTLVLPPSGIDSFDELLDTFTYSGRAGQIVVVRNDELGLTTIAYEIYTTAEKNKLAGIETGAQVNVNPDWNFTDPSDKRTILNKPQDAGIISYGTYSLLGQDLTLSAGWVWRINNTIYSNASPILINFPYAASGLQRLDLVVFNTSNSATRIGGFEVVSNPTANPVPVNTVYFSISLVTDSTVGDPSIPTNPDITSDDVENLSGVTGANVTEALDYIDDNVIHTTGDEEKNGNLNIVGRLGVNGLSVNDNPTDPPHVMDITNDAAGLGIDQYLLQATAYANNAGWANVHIRKARGTADSPLAVLNQDIISSWGLRGYATTKFASSSAAFQAIAEENFTDTANGTSILFQVTPIGAFDARIDVLKLETTGEVKLFNLAGTGDRMVAVGSTGILKTITDLIFGTFINSLTGKTTPIDADSISIVDSADSNKQKKVSLTNFKAYLKTYFDTLYASPVPQITITTVVSITTATTDGAGLGQKGRNVIIANGASAINITVNGGTDFCASYVKNGMGAITFVQGSGRTLVQVDSTAILNGIAGSSASISSVGTTDYLRISNA